MFNDYGRVINCKARFPDGRQPDPEVEGQTLDQVTRRSKGVSILSSQFRQKLIVFLAAEMERLS